MLFVSSVEETLPRSQFHCLRSNTRAVHQFLLMLSGIALVLACFSFNLYADEANTEQMRQARRLYLTGRYRESEAGYKLLAESNPVPAAQGIANCLIARGEYEEARQDLEDAIKAYPDAAALPAQLAELSFNQGDYELAEKLVEQALKLDENQLAARWVKAELLAARGKLTEANDAYDWFISYYNAADEIDDADDLLYIGQGAAQFARWNRLSDQFSFLVNDLYPEAGRLESNYWPASYAAGCLFLEKYNEAEAAKSLKAALALNASSADIHAALAELAIQNFELESAQRSIRAALTINPNHLRAHLMQADYHLANFEPDVAVGVLEEALKLNPRSEETRGRLAAAYGMVDGLAKDLDSSRMGKEIERALEQNPHCGIFFFALGQALDKGRKFPTAATYFSKAVEVLPQHPIARGQLGLMQMRLGEEETALKILEESFDIDPFNVRVINSIKVLEVLDGYETLETAHFILKFDPEKDKLLAQYAARYLEEVYPELCRRLDFTPPEKSLFEIFNNARNTDGHGWFSARMVGLPKIHTIGACAGKMVALTSPGAMKQNFNWAKVLKHEFVHVINLQQTNFNIPHWYTEALAVLLEDSPRSAEWNKMLTERVPAGKVFNLDSINLGFIRPSSGEDWQMAYCQAEIYAEYMIKRFGEDAPGKMLAGYRDNLNTADAIQRAFNVEVEDFEKGYTEHLNAIVDSLSPKKTAKTPRTMEALQQLNKETPGDPEVMAELAFAYLMRKQFPTAGQWADKALAKEEKQPLATYVKARLLISIGEGRRAVEMLEGALDKESPQLEVVRLLAGLRFRSEDYAAAAELYQLAEEHEPDNPEWTKSLAMVYLKSGDKEKLISRLEQLAEADGDDLTLRKKLAELAFEQQDYAEAAKWANQCLQIDVMDASMHVLLGKALLEQKKPGPAVIEFAAASFLQPKDSSLQISLAKAQIAAEEDAAARETLSKLLQNNANHAEAQELLRSLGAEEDPIKTTP